MATLYMVATPIGNLGDMTLRAIETLKSVDSIACEDTRHTLKLLNHFEIKKPLIACYAYDEERGASRMLEILDSGRNLAYCSDAGTPCMSDPGRLAVAKAREKGHVVVPLPGPSAFPAIISVCGFALKSVLFEGFLSPKPGRRRSRLAELMAREEAFVVYESPHRIIKFLTDCADIDAERMICLGRELTKMHEEILCDRVAVVRDTLNSRQRILGEFAVLVTGWKKA